MAIVSQSLLPGLLFALSATALSQGTTMEALRDRQRVLLVFGNGDNQLSEAQLAVAAEHVAGFHERDLVLTGLQGTNPALPTVMLSPDEEKAARKRFQVAAGEFTAILVGKDGGEKLRSHRPISWDKLASTIDAMPMRKDELKSGNTLR